MHINRFYCWIHSRDFELWPYSPWLWTETSFTRPAMVPSSSFELSKILYSVLLLGFTSLFFFSHMDSWQFSNPYSWDVKCWEQQGKDLCQFYHPLPPAQRKTIRILKAVFTLVTWCLWKEDMGLFLLLEMYSLHHFPLPAQPYFLDKNCDAPPLKWNTTELSFFCLWQHVHSKHQHFWMKGMSLFLSSSHDWSLMLVLLRLQTDTGRKKRHWEDSDRRRLTDNDSGVLRRKRPSSGYWLFPDRNVLDCIFFRSSQKVAVGSICKEIYYAYV